MNKDKNKTEVLFLIEKDDEDNKTVFAFFPKEKYNKEFTLFISYAHLGQHSSCCKTYANQCKQATKDEYRDLKAELESIGYNLTILNK